MKQTVGKIMDAINLMLPKGSEDAVLHDIMQSIKRRLHPADVAPSIHPERLESASSIFSDMLLQPTLLLAENRPGDRDRSPSPDMNDAALEAVGLKPRIRLLTSVMRNRSENWQPLQNALPGSGDRGKNMTYEHRQRKRHTQRSRTVAMPVASPHSRIVVKLPQPEAARGVLSNDPIQVRNAANSIIAYRCPRCPQQKSTKKEVMMHLAFHGISGKFACNECDFATDSKVMFYYHAMAHSKKETGQPGARKKRTTLRNPSAADDLFSNPASPTSSAAEEGIACVIPNCSFMGPDRQSIAEHLRKEHGPWHRVPPSMKVAATPKPPMKGPAVILTGGRKKGAKRGPRVRARAVTVASAAMSRHQCVECPDAFGSKTQLYLHRCRAHPRRRGRKPKEPSAQSLATGMPPPLDVSVAESSEVWTGEVQSIGEIEVE
ncbi:uncharacterized protein LOC129597204 isoform X2 [Paramacrobiotus metropolitanus]|nr:uncharacterized protein LOC129597204 isoform X2 [Paramacrobiotus metropolitanus]